MFVYFKKSCCRSGETKKNPKRQNTLGYRIATLVGSCILPLHKYIDEGGNLAPFDRVAAAEEFRENRKQLEE